MNKKTGITGIAKFLFADYNLINTNDILDTINEKKII